MSNKVSVITLSMFTVFALGTAQVAQAAATSCADKKTEVEIELKAAKKFDNYHEVVALEKALDRIDAYCTSETIASDIKRKIAKTEHRIAEKKIDITEIQADLAEVKAKGKMRKVAKYEARMKEKELDISELTMKLDELKKELSSVK